MPQFIPLGGELGIAKFPTTISFTLGRLLTGDWRMARTRTFFFVWSLLSFGMSEYVCLSFPVHACVVTRRYLGRRSNVEDGLSVESEQQEEYHQNFNMFWDLASVGSSSPLGSGSSVIRLQCALNCRNLRKCSDNLDKSTRLPCALGCLYLHV